MRLTKTFTALALAASLAMFPACSDTKYRNLGGGTAPSACSPPAFVSHMMGTSLAGPTGDVLFAGPAAIVDAAGTPISFDLTAGVETADSLTAIAEGSEATAGIPSGTTLTDFETIDAALKGLDTVFGAAGIAKMQGFEVTAADNEAALAKFATEAKVELMNVVDEATGQLTKATGLLSAAKTTLADVFKTATSLNANPGTGALTEAWTFDLSQTALAGLKMTIAGLVTDDTDEDVIIGVEVLKAIGFGFAAASGSGEWVTENNSSELADAISGDTLYTPLASDLAALAGAEAAIETALATGGDLVAKSSHDEKKLVLGKMEKGQELTYSAFGYYKETASTQATGETEETIGSSTTSAFYGDNGKAFNRNMTAQQLADAAITAATLLEADDEVTFKGKTVAALNVDGNYSDIAGTATLTLTTTSSTASEHLLLGFSNWYDMEFTGVSAGNLIYKTASFGDNTLTIDQGTLDSNNKIAITGSWEAKYASENFALAVAADRLPDTEATGKYHAENANVNDFDKTFTLDGAFGVKAINTP